MSSSGDGAHHETRIAALDGLRAIAVYLVVAFHSGLGWFGGGFIGVDVFFVLSGYLITRLLLVEQITRGRLDMVRFYARRALRLLPSAWLAIAGTTVVFAFLATPLERREVIGDARSAVLYFANWNFIDRGSDYFADSITSSPFLHLWSLAVEEQFYVAWPIITLGIVALWRRSPVAARTLVASCAVVGFVAARVVADSNLLRAYYGTDLRAYQLLAGAALAALLLRPDGSSRRPLRAATADALVLVGIGGILVAAITLDGWSPIDRGGFATMCTVAALLGLVARRSSGLTDGALGWRPFEQLGRLSYGTYLWHWPVIVLLERVVVIGHRLLFVTAVIAATGLAKLSLDLVETPILRWGRTPDRKRHIEAIGAGLAGALLLGAVAIPGILRADLPTLEAANRVGFVPTARGTTDGGVAAPLPPATAPPPLAPNDEPPNTTTSAPEPTDAANTTVAPTAPPSTSLTPREVDLPPFDAGPNPVPADLGLVDFGPAANTGCVNIVPTSAEQCTAVEGSGLRVLMIGDSHGSKMHVGLAEYASNNDVALATATMNGCPWADGLLYRDALPVEEAKQFCREQTAAVYDWLPDAFDADVVVVVTHDVVQEAYTVVPSGAVDFPAELTGLDLATAAAERSLDTLTADGRVVVIAEPIPTSPFDPPSCLSAVDVTTECDFDVASWPPADTLIYREFAAERPQVRTADLTTLVCPNFPTCTSVINGVAVREDIDHLYGAFVVEINELLAARLGI